MPSYQLYLSTDRKTIKFALVGSGEAGGAGYTAFGAPIVHDHDQDVDALKASSATHVMYHHIREQLYHTLHSNPTSSTRALFPKGIYDVSRFTILAAGPLSGAGWLVVQPLGLKVGGGTKTIRVVAMPEGTVVANANLDFTVTPASVATATAAGVVTPVAAGSITVTAKPKGVTLAQAIKKGSSKQKVLPADPPPVG